MKSLLIISLLIPAALQAAVPRTHVTSTRSVTSVDAISVTDPTMLPRLMAELRALRTNPAAHATAVADSRSVRSFVIPAAGSTPGGGGSLYFRSDVTLVNYGATAENVYVAWWPAGSSNPITSTNTTTLTKIISVPAGQAVTYVDFVANVLQTQGLGALVFIPVTSGNTIDVNGAIDGFSRIYTQQPGSTGTVSQEFNAVDVDSLVPGSEAVSLGLRQDDGFRTNFGILNADEVPHTFNVQFIGEQAQSNVTVTVPAFGMVQQAMPSGTYGALSIVYTITDALTPTLSWTAYGTSTDNTTGDGWVALASADMAPSDLTSIGQ